MKRPPKLILSMRSRRYAEQTTSLPPPTLHGIRVLRLNTSHTDNTNEGTALNARRRSIMDLPQQMGIAMHPPWTGAIPIVVAVSRTWIQIQIAMIRRLVCIWTNSRVKT
jgi:hypothetical protein